MTHSCVCRCPGDHGKCFAAPAPEPSLGCGSPSPTRAAGLRGHGGTRLCLSTPPFPYLEASEPPASGREQQVGSPVSGAGVKAWWQLCWLGVLTEGECVRAMGLHSQTRPSSFQGDRLMPPSAPHPKGPRIKRIPHPRVRLWGGRGRASSRASGSRVPSPSPSSADRDGAAPAGVPARTVVTQAARPRTQVWRLLIVCDLPSPLGWVFMAKCFASILPERIIPERQRFVGRVTNRTNGQHLSLPRPLPGRGPS